MFFSYRRPRYYFYLIASLCLSLAGATAQAAPYTCSTTKVVKQAGGGDCTTIQDCVVMIPASLSGDYCIDIQDSATYSEQVTIQHKDTGIYQIVIGSNTQTNRPIINPPVLSTAAFRIVNSSVTLLNMDIISTNTVAYGIYASSGFVTISSVNVDSGGAISAAGIFITSDTVVFNSSVTVQNAIQPVYGLRVAGRLNTVDRSTITSNGEFSTALFLNTGASSNTVTRSYIGNNAGGQGATLQSNANHNTISLSTVTISGSGVTYALVFTGASSNTLTQSYVYAVSGYGLSLESNANYNTVSFSTIANVGVNGHALTINTGASYNTVTQSRISGTEGWGVRIEINANFNTISLSTITSVDTGAITIEPAVALLISNAFSNTLTRSYLAPTAKGYGAQFTGQANDNTISLSTVTGSVYASLFIDAAASNTVTRSSLLNMATFDANANYNTISFSTITGVGANYALNFQLGSSSNTVTNSYIQASTAVYINGSIGAIINSSVLVATNTSGSGVWLTGTSENLFMSSNTILAEATGAGIFIDKTNTGRIMLSTNTIRSGPQYGIYAATQTSATQIWITSNTIFPALSTSRDTYGIYLDGLTSGATIQNNNIYHRISGSMSGRTSYGLFAKSVSSTNIDHNRISQPGMVTAGSYVAAYFAGVQQTQFKFNDVNSTGTDLTNAYLLRLTGSTITVQNNIFLSSVTVGVSGSSASLHLSANSGIDSNYNDFFSSNSLNSFTWGNNSKQFGATGGWFSKDANSLNKHPRWFNSDVGVEDFHPKSAGGRYDPSTQNFVNDATHSQTIDRADTADTVEFETAPDGGRPNQGSYGNTDQASRSPGGCEVIKTVCGGGCDHTTIQAAVDALGPKSMTERECVIIEDSAAYAGSVKVQGFTNNNHRLVIMSNPSLPLRPSASLPGGTAVFELRNDSVTLSGIDVKPSGALAFQILASSANAIISSVTVEGGNRNVIAAVGISSYATLSYSSVTVTTQGRSLLITGVGAEVSLSTFASNNALLPTLEVNGGSSHTLTNISVLNLAGDSVKILNTNFSTIRLSTIVTAGVGFSGLLIQGSSWNVVAQSSISSVSGTGVQLDATANYNTISFSTVTGSGNDKYGMHILGASNTVTNSYIQGSTAIYISGSTGTVVNSSVLFATNTFGSGLALVNGSINLSLSSNTLSGGTNNSALYFQEGNKGRITVSTNTLFGARYGIYVATQTLNATQIYVTSNTILPALSLTQDTYGIYLDGLASGATIQNNGIYHRTSGSMSGRTSYGVFAKSVSLTNIDHNRISQPGMLADGSFVAAYFAGVQTTQFKFNDVNSTGTGLTNAYLLQLAAGSTVTVKNNVFFSSVTVTVSGSSATLHLSDNSGVDSNYNDFFSSNSLNSFVWGPQSQQFTSGWFGKDANSIAAHPQWFNPVGGVEDFHPRSTVGRYDPATQAFATDGQMSPTIDAADPLEAFGLESTPNNERANQGSYGNTTQASRSGNALCPVTKTVCDDGCDFTVIRTAIDAIPNPMTQHSCVHIKSSDLYNEVLTISHYSLNGSSLAIISGLDNKRATLAPGMGGETTVFTLRSASAAVRGLDIMIPSYALSSFNYGILVSSPNAFIHDVNVYDPNSFISVAALYITTSMARVSQSSFTATLGSAYGGYFSDAPYFTISNSSFTTVRQALALSASSSGTLSGLTLQSSNNTALQITNSYSNTVSLSTITGTNKALHISLGASHVISGSYIQGSTAVYVSGSTGTVLNSNRLVALAAVAGTRTGVHFLNGSVDLAMSSNTILGGAEGAGVRLELHSGGRIILSTNTILAGARYGISIATQTPGTSIWVTSNTILATVSTAYDTYGIYLDGLTSGATIQNNGVYHRSAGDMTGRTSYGLFAKSVSLSNIDHNRISQPGMLADGSYVAAYFAGVQTTQFKFNDVNSTGTNLTNAYLLQLTAGSTVTVKNNVFFSSVTVSGSSATLHLSLNSGVDSDYNDYFSSNSLNSFVWGAQSKQFSSGWFGKDANSIAAHPQWFKPGAGIEDFHPMSKAPNGRYNPATGLFDQTDTVQSPTIDAAAPDEAVDLEPVTNGGRANQGSYGQTAQASLTFVQLCPVVKTVCASGCDAATIQSGVNSIPNPMTQHSCVVIQDSGIYDETVTLSHYSLNGSSLAVVGAAGLNPRPRIRTTAGTEAFALQSASASVRGIDVFPNAALTYGIRISSPNAFIHDVNIDDTIYVGGPYIGSMALYITSAMARVSRSSFISDGTALGARINDGSYFDVSDSTFTSGSGIAMRLTNSSSGTLTNLFLHSNASQGLIIYPGTNNTVSLSTITGNSASSALLISLASSSNTITQSYIFNESGDAAVIDEGSTLNTIRLSTMTTHANKQSALRITNASSNTVTGSYLSSTDGTGAGLTAQAHYNTLSLNTITGDRAGDFGFRISNSSYNAVTQSHITGSQGYGAEIAATAGHNTISLSTITGRGDFDAAYGLGIQGTSNTVSGCYIQGSTAVYVSGSTGTVVNSSVLVATNTMGSALSLLGTSVNLSMSSNTLIARSGGAGIYLGESNKGRITLSTNTISGARYGVFIATQTLDATQIYVTSNTILPALSLIHDTYGIYLDGLASGATIQNNGLYHRTSGSMAGKTSYGIFAKSVSLTNIDHNRISQPGLLTAGSFIGASFAGAQTTQFKFNDVNSTGTGLTNAYLLQLTAGSTITVKNNVFLSSVTVTVSGSSATLHLSVNSGVDSNYNDFFSSNSLNSFVWGAQSKEFSSGWYGKDADSIAAHPQWFNHGTSIEDFHPRSTVGRYDPSTQAFVVDTLMAATIDAADPAEAFGLESTPNNDRANQGSYGNTAQASRSGSVVPPLCPIVKTVCAAICDSPSIQGAVNAIPNPLTGYSCVVIKSAGIYNEQVTVQNFTNNGSSFTIMLDPALSERPTVNPPASSTAAFLIANSSVNIFNIDIKPGNAVAYGIYASSGFVTISSVNVDSGGKIWTAGVHVSSDSIVSNSSVTVQNAHGLWVVGRLNTVTQSTFTSNSNDLPTLSLVQASTNIVTRSHFSNLLGIGAQLVAEANHNTISLTTVTSLANHALQMLTSSSNTLTQNYFFSSVRVALSLESVHYNTIRLSTIANNTASYAALDLGSGSYNTLTQNYITNSQGIGAQFDSGSYNNISQSTITSSGSASYALYLNASASNTISGSYIQGSTAVYVGASTGTVLNSNILIAANAAGNAVIMDGGSVNLSLSSNTILGGEDSAGIRLNAGNSGLITLSTNTIRGAQYGIMIATQTPATTIWVTSNTILATLSTAHDTYGLYLDGLASGATIQNNGIYHRTSGPMLSKTSYGLFAKSVSLSNIDHNRISQPGMLTAGSFVAAYFAGVQTTQFKFNDVNSTGTGLTNAYLLQLTASSTVTVKNNVFLSSVTVTVSGSSATLHLSVNSGVDSNYNDYFSSNSFNSFVWGAQSKEFSSGWYGKDANSLASHPLWHHASASIEDFHPHSLRGRWDPTTQSFVLDTSMSPTIDAAEPTEDYAVEPDPDGSRANQGSYGNTLEASKSAPYPSSLTVVAVWASSVTVGWSPLASDGYQVDASTAADFTGLVFSSTTANPAATQLAPQDLWSNTTYFLRVAALYSGTPHYSPTHLSTSTLAQSVAGSQIYGIWVTSMTVNWIPRPAVPTEVSSMTAEGYRLDISTRADFTPLWAASSATPNVMLSTLSIGGLPGGNTYFFRVGALNWNNQANYALAVSTLLPLQYGVALSTHELTLPGMTDMNSVLVISTSIIATNIGNATATYRLRATTTTSGSPWAIGTTAGVDRYVVWSVVNSTQPATIDFGAEDKLADPDTEATASVFTMGNETGVSLPMGQTRLLWFQFWTPLASSTSNDQKIEIRARAQPPAP